MSIASAQNHTYVHGISRYLFTRIDLIDQTLSGNVIHFIVTSLYTSFKLNIGAKVFGMPKKKEKTIFNFQVVRPKV